MHPHKLLQKIEREKPHCGRTNQLALTQTPCRFGDSVHVTCEIFLTQCVFAPRRRFRSFGFSVVTWHAHGWSDDVDVASLFHPFASHFDIYLQRALTYGYFGMHACSHAYRLQGALNLKLVWTHCLSSCSCIHIKACVRSCDYRKEARAGHRDLNLGFL